MTDLDRLNIELSKAKIELAKHETNYTNDPNRLNWNCVVIANDIVLSLQDDIIKLLSTR